MYWFCWESLRLIRLYCQRSINWYRYLWYNQIVILYINLGAYRYAEHSKRKVDDSPFSEKSNFMRKCSYPCTKENTWLILRHFGLLRKGSDIRRFMMNPESIVCEANGERFSCLLKLKYRRILQTIYWRFFYEESKFGLDSDSPCLITNKIICSVPFHKLI